MGINYQRIINSRLGVGFTLTFARLLPPKAGYRFANFIADRISSRPHLNLIQSARINQWVANGEGLSADQLDRAVSQTMRHTARCLYDTYHYFKDEEAISRLVVISPSAREWLAEAKKAEEGSIIVGLHLSNFDFVAQAVSGTELEALALAFPQPTGGYRWQNEIRRDSGMQIMPTSLDSMRKARRLLKEGGIVLTAIDRPLEASNYPIRFFGRKAFLPLHHIALALKTEAPIYVVAVIMNSEGQYEVVYSDPVKIEKTGDRTGDMIHNGEKVMSIAEEYIRLAPNQWSMYYPVWPEVQDSLP
jgi:KDO2-lipid IV(A) lauroyltransferase